MCPGFVDLHELDTAVVHMGFRFHSYNVPVYFDMLIPSRWSEQYALVVFFKRFSANEIYTTSAFGVQVPVKNRLTSLYNFKFVNCEY